MKIKSICSIQGTAVENEDALGSFGNFFWVIDGATDLYNAKKSIGYSVSEVTHLLSKVIAKHCVESKTLKEIFSESIKEVRSIIGLDDFNHEEYYKLPTFAFVFAKLTKTKLEYMILGDCVVLVNDKEITDHRVDRLFDLGKNEIAHSSKDGVQRKTILQKIRELANTSNGYWIGSLDESCVEHAIYESTEVTSNQIVLMSDGFYEFYSQHPEDKLDDLIVMRKQSQEVDPIYGKKDDASILVVDLLKD